MAILKHIKSRNANYSDAQNYLLYQHDEKSGKPVLDEYGNKLLRELHNILNGKIDIRPVLFIKPLIFN